MTLRDTALQAKAASRRLATLSSDAKNAALEAIAAALEAGADRIREANDADLAEARASGLAAPLLKRLSFQGHKVTDAAAGLRSLRGLPEPVGRVLARTELDEGLVLTRVTCPLGVIGVIFESRPDALVQISALCLKSGNACLLKGGREALRTNRALAAIVRDAAASAGIPDGWMQLLETRDEVAEMLALDDLVDLVIPRGSNEFVRHIMATSRIPVMGHAAGVCHVYVDKAADPAMALAIAEDAKCQYPAVCNACETLLVHSDIAPTFLPALAERLAARGVELRGCERTCALLTPPGALRHPPQGGEQKKCGAPPSMRGDAPEGQRGVIPATDADWDAEYLDLILSVRVVDSLDEAIAHIHRHGSGHTEAIVTADVTAAERFLDEVDAADVFWNASTRFADGYRFGLGAEVGISTSKLHARGPVGLDGLLSTKWLLRGSGQVVAPYADGTRAFTHRRLDITG